ncbi:hypothetical protein [Kiloniella majae]|uniref:hypothetical protein n=1 Tax=Kiloniella majae TaxID=1938558 RepID=UPI000A277708|nr:hypothetical protein [Kiloniella majae]
MVQSLSQGISSARSLSTHSIIPSAKLELTYPYFCGMRVAAEFDARVTIGLEDNVLVLGEVDLFCYDDKHQGAYESCADKSLCEQIRNYVENSIIERARALEHLQQQKDFEHCASQTPSIHSNQQGFASFVKSYTECLAPSPD